MLKNIISSLIFFAVVFVLAACSTTATMVPVDEQAPLDKLIERLKKEPEHRMTFEVKTDDGGTEVYAAMLAYKYGIGVLKMSDNQNYVGTLTIIDLDVTDGVIDRAAWSKDPSNITQLDRKLYFDQIVKIMADLIDQ